MSTTDELYVGVDTSAYTTSLAAVDGDGALVLNTKKQLTVRLGERGLRQSDAVFLHIKNALDILDGALFPGNVRAVCYSAAPRPADGSYMPVFLVGGALARAMACGAGVSVYTSTHQHGHIYAALYGNGVEDGEWLCFHSSGGTMELLSAHVEGGFITSVEFLGGTGDITAGKLIDRIGVTLGMAFPSGEHMESIASPTSLRLPVTVHGLSCNLSGAEAQAMALIEGGADGGEVATAVFECIARTSASLVLNASARTGIRNALLFGGVFQNETIRANVRSALKEKGVGCAFAQRGLSGDNAAGLALYCKNRYLKEAHG